MNKLLLLLNLCLVCNTVWSQLPYMNTPTVIPQSPTSTDVIKIVTKVMTPNQSIVVDPTTFSVTQNPKEIKIRACYWQGMSPATQTFVDTLNIGQLPAGTYVITQKAYLSSGQQICHPTDSNFVTINFSVATITGIQEDRKTELNIFPNPANDKIYIENSGFVRATLYTTEGRILQTVDLKEKTEIDLQDLANGLYFISLSDKDNYQVHKFIKN